MDVFFTLDLIGTAVFAFTGATAAKHQRFHALGVLCIAAVTAVGGGTLRSLLLQTPELFWMKNSAYLTVIILVVLASYLIRINTDRLWFYILDSLSLAVFVAVGASITLHVGQPLHIAFAMGVLTGIGGGLIRDAITSQPPQALSDPAYPMMLLAAGLGSILSVHIGLEPWTLSLLAVLSVVTFSATFNYVGTGNWVKYHRPQANHVGDDNFVTGRESGFRSQHQAVIDSRDPVLVTPFHRPRIRNHRTTESKSGSHVALHAFGLLLLLSAATFFYLQHSISGTTSMQAGSTSTVATSNNLAVEKLKYSAMLNTAQTLLNTKQLHEAEQQIAKLKASHFADTRIEPLIIHSNNLRAYLNLLDQAELALASNDSTKLNVFIDKASSFGFSGMRLATLKASLDSLQQHERIKAADRALAKDKYNLHLARAEHQLSIGNYKLANAEVKLANTFGIKDGKLNQIQNQIFAVELFNQTPLRELDFENASLQFNQLKKAIKLKNLTAIRSLTMENQDRNKLFNTLFNRYTEINASVKMLSMDDNTKTVNATLQLESMRLPDGNIAYPPTSYGVISLSMQRTREGWTRINW